MERPMKTLVCLALLAQAAALLGASSQSTSPQEIRFTTGNLSVDAIQHSSIGAQPDPSFSPALPSPKQLEDLFACGLRGYEDYIAWGMVEPEEGHFDFSRHRRVCELLAQAGMPYIPYIWCHVPPKWLRDGKRATLMQCNEHGKPCYMFSIFDPATLKWYEHFYRALHAEFGDKIGETYACILGPYGEGNYPLPYVDWVVPLGHCHEGYWCGDAYALAAFRKAMASRYATTDTLNRAWGSDFKSFDELTFPEEIKHGLPGGFDKKNAQGRRRWLDFISWYHGALVEFAGKSADMVVGIFGRNRTAIKPGGNSGWMNPLSWGTYCPAFARIAGQRGIAVQSADSRGAYWADKWCSTAYAFYGADYRTEAAGALSHEDFIKRTFSDVSCGSKRLFTYEIEKHLDDATRTLHLYSGERARTPVALLAPSTRYLLGSDVMPAVRTGMALRDYFDYDVVDEQLISDRALVSPRFGSAAYYSPWRTLVAIDCDIVEAAVLGDILKWVEHGGTLVWASSSPVEDVEGKRDWPINRAAQSTSSTLQAIPYGSGRIYRTSSKTRELAAAVLKVGFADQRQDPNPIQPIDAQADSVWMSEFSDKLLLLNFGKKPLTRTIHWRGQSRQVLLPPFEIVSCSAK